jgi:hypothetical protein
MAFSQVFGLWSRAPDLPGDVVAFSEPGVSGFALTNIFVRGSDNRIYQTDYDGIGFHEWAEVPGDGLTLSGPAATFFAPPVITPHGLMLFVRGTDNRIYQNILPTLETRWLGWTEVPGDGLTISKPAPIEYGGDLRLFVRGTNDRIYENVFDIVQIAVIGFQGLRLPCCPRSATYV